MSTLERAIEIAAKAHAGQVDKAGEPYIIHPIRVMLRVTSIEARISAVLHDVVEDSDVTVDELRNEGFSEVVLQAVEALTKRPGENRIQAALRAVSNETARKVKLADNAENMDLSRIPNPTAKDHARVKEYEKVREILLGSNGAH
ncbi:MAG: HD domain-containing protein [Gammaproteobacteria bacterium]|nr:HD domain-containing protein [Gammaproteobacteria bacterium]